MTSPSVAAPSFACPAAAALCALWKPRAGPHPGIASTVVEDKLHVHDLPA